MEAKNTMSQFGDRPKTQKHDGRCKFFVLLNLGCIEIMVINFYSYLMSSTMYNSSWKILYTPPLSHANPQIKVDHRRHPQHAKYNGACLTKKSVPTWNQKYLSS